MDLEAMAEKYSMKDLRPLAKKMDIIKALPPEGGRRQAGLALQKMTY